jgi:nicotinamidase-related amidase
MGMTQRPKIPVRRKWIQAECFPVYPFTSVLRMAANLRGSCPFSIEVSPWRFGLEPILRGDQGDVNGKQRILEPPEAIWYRDYSETNREGRWMAQQAVIVIDMLNDFVTGSLKCDRAERIIKPLRKLVTSARAKGVPVIYSNDCHHRGIDRELNLWGDHAIAGTKGAEVIPELEPGPGDYVVPKRRYSGFFQTDLQLLLNELGTDTVIMTGLHANMCLRHTAADAYYWGFRIVVPRDGTEAFTEEDYQGGLDYLAKVYGAELTTVDDLIKTF